MLHAHEQEQRRHASRMRPPSLSLSSPHQHPSIASFYPPSSPVSPLLATSNLASQFLSTTPEKAETSPPVQRIKAEEVKTEATKQKKKATSHRALKIDEPFPIVQRSEVCQENKDENVKVSEKVVVQEVKVPEATVPTIRYGSLSFDCNVTNTSRIHY